MSYAIGYIVYGVNLTASAYGGNPPAYTALKDLQDEHGEYILSEFMENEQAGFMRRYSGGGDQPEWFGIEVGEIDECNEVDGASLRAKLEPTEETMAEYQALLDGLDTTEEFANILKAQTPKMMILWGSS